jgi:hypothetical protein
MILDERTTKVREAILQYGLPHVANQSHHVRDIVLCNELDSNGVVGLAQVPQALTRYVISTGLAGARTVNDRGILSTRFELQNARGDQCHAESSRSCGVHAIEHVYSQSRTDY